MSKIISIFILLTLSINAQFKLENWQTHSSMLSIHTLSVDSKQRIWGASNGGLFIIDLETLKTQEIRNINQLLSLQTTTLKCDTLNKRVFAGTYDGILEIISEDFQFTHITDIKSQNFSNPTINDIQIHNSKVYIAGGFGLAVFDPEKNVFVETVLRIGTLQSQTPIRKIYFWNNEIWLATEKGIAKANLNNYIADPNNWTVYSTAEGLSDYLIYDLTAANDTLYAISKYNLYKYADNQFSLLKSFSDNGNNLTGIYSFKNELYISTLWSLDIYQGKHFSYKANDHNSGFIVMDYQGKNLYILKIRNNGLDIYDETTNLLIKPNTPSSNIYNELDVDIYGNLWAASDKSNSGNGFMTLNKNTNKWKNFVNYDNKEIISNGFFKISCLNDGKILASTWGYGYILVEQQDTNYTLSVYNEKNTPMVSTSLDAPSWIIPGKAAMDRNGVTWIVNYGESNPGPNLIAMDKSNKFYPFFNCYSYSLRYSYEMVIDANNTKWLASSNENGLYYFNENNSLENPNDDICGYFKTSSSSILDNTQTSLAVDATGMLWIGTKIGLCVLVNPSSVLGKSKSIIRNITLLGNNSVNDIMVDALNNKWIATNNGVYVINSDASEIIYQITTTNSPIPSNKVLSLATNKHTGEIFFGTENGLSAVNSLSIQPNKNYDISCYPQPFNPNTDEVMVIDGLSDEAEIKILTLNGEIIKTLRTTSKRTIWNGRDEKGNIVDNGVYMIVATSNGYSANGVAKFAILKK